MTQNIDRQELAKKAHAAAVAKGFWDEEHSPEHYLMLAIMDLSGAVEAHQVSHRADYEAHKRALIDPESKEGVIARSMGEAFVDETAFEEHIAYTLEDKLADAYIRLLDLSEAFGLPLSNSGTFEFYSEKTLTEQIFLAVQQVSHEGAMQRDPAMPLMIVEAIAKAHDIDLLWHITEKMKYNETRPARHGKEY